MREKGFIYNGCVYFIGRVDWIEKNGSCSNASCNNNLKDRDDLNKCQTNLLGHCCKHVINGTDFEQEKFKFASGYQGDIPNSLQAKSDVVVQHYHEVSKKVAEETTAVSMSGEKKSVRITCEGNGKTEGAIDFIAFDEKIYDDYRGNEIKSYNMGIVSNFFNGCNPELFCVYRLLFQKYEEKRAWGKKVCCMPLLLDQEIDIPKLDIAINRAPQLYTSKKKNDDYSLAALYVYFYEKYHELFDVFYRNICNSPDLYKINPDSLIDINGKDELHNSLKKVIKFNEKIYQVHVMLEYMLLIKEEAFMPFLLYGDNYCMKLGDYMKEYSAKYIKERKKVQYELGLQRRLLIRKYEATESHYKDVMEKIVEAIAENEKSDNGVGSIADYTAYSIVSTLVEYFIDVYVFANKMKEIYGLTSPRFGIAREEYKKWKELFESIHAYEKGEFFMQWWVIFNRLMQVDKRMAELDKMMR